MITGNRLLRVYLDNYLYDNVRDILGSSMMMCFIFITLYAVFKMLIGFLLALGYKHSIVNLVDYITKKEVYVIREKIYKRLK